MIPWRALRRRGVMGINERNSRLTLRINPRQHFPRVDDKLRSKALCQAAGIPVPGLLAVARHHFELRQLVEKLASYSSFVVKPARGAMGNGILVILARDGERLLRPGGRSLSTSDLAYHAAGIISGLYSLSGQTDVAMVEERLVVHPDMARISTDGIPDVRVIIYRGVPIMAMTRLPTARSAGRANLHQGAIGAGIDLSSGRITHAVLHNDFVGRHPDNGEPLRGCTVPEFARVLEIAVAAADQTGLGYVGADAVVDAALGPMILELNARPGLAIQMANHAGLLPRLEAVDRDFRPELPLAERVELGRRIAREATEGRGA